MKLMVCITQKLYGNVLIQQLASRGFRVTKLASSGGFLKQGNDTLLIGVANEDIERLQQEMKNIVLAAEKEKGIKGTEHRYVSFIIDSQQFIPKIATQH